MKNPTARMLVWRVAIRYFHPTPNLTLVPVGRRLIPHFLEQLKLIMTPSMEWYAPRLPVDAVDRTWVMYLMMAQLQQASGIVSIPCVSTLKKSSVSICYLSLSVLENLKTYMLY